MRRRTGGGRKEKYGLRLKVEASAAASLSIAHAITE